MKITAKDLPSFVETLPASIRVVLVYGEDFGQVKELVKTISQSVIENVDDPFALKNITIGSGDESSSSLYDEVNSQSFGFGKTVEQEPTRAQYEGLRFAHAEECERREPVQTEGLQRRGRAARGAGPAPR